MQTKTKVEAKTSKSSKQGGESLKSFQSKQVCQVKEEELQRTMITISKPSTEQPPPKRWLTKKVKQEAKHTHGSLLVLEALTARPEVSNVLMASPAHAGVLFDFNLTLPIIAGQFLALMFILDKVVFSPIGEILDKRDGELARMARIL